jgi:hypothetical protein
LREQEVVEETLSAPARLIELLKLPFGETEVRHYQGEAGVQICLRRAEDVRLPLPKFRVLFDLAHDCTAFPCDAISSSTARPIT